MKNEFYTDRVSTNDKYGESGSNNRRSLFKTDITLTDYKGNEIVNIARHRHNMTILSGRISVLEKAFGIVPDANQRLLLSDLIPTPSNEGATSGNSDVLSMDDDPTYATLHEANTIFGVNGKNFQDKVNYFCIGNGGENPNTPYAILDVHDWETRLYNMVPFRCVPISADLTAEERKNYRLRKVIEIDGNKYYGYYAKVFNPGKIISQRSGIDYTPAKEDSNPYIGNGDGHSMNGHTSEIFITFELEIAANEFKEYYRLLNSDTLTGARLTELGLISGYDGPSGDTNVSGLSELYDPTLFAKLTHEPVFLSTENSRRKVTYSVFA